MEPLNSYLGMGDNDFLFAKSGVAYCGELGNYNSVASLCAQAAEKYLKAVIERKFVEDETCITILHTHNLRTLVNKIKEKYPDTSLNSIECKWLGDFYFDARYPGDNFIIVNEEDALECIRITEQIRTEINRILAIGLSNQQENNEWSRQSITLDDMKQL